MEIVIADNSKERLKSISNQLIKCCPGCSVKLFSDPMLACKYILSHDIAGVLLQRNMGRIDGECLCRLIRKNKPEMNVCIYEQAEMAKPPWLPRLSPDTADMSV